jgi:two-component system, chemotaxis family, protein-glutamate methylesterase/glutaminase
VLLSGMGNDGAQEMRALYDLGATTLVQDKESSLIHGIPGEAIKLGAARHVLPLQQIAPALLTLTGYDTAAQRGR